MPLLSTIAGPIITIQCTLPSHKHCFYFFEVFRDVLLTTCCCIFVAFRIGDTNLKAYRVDLSKTGDSILSDIVDNIAHSQMVVADVSIMGYDSKTGVPYRNANVLYEIGVALACRQPTEVLLIRDDEQKFLFDVSTIPHKKLNFADVNEARTQLQQELVERLRERQIIDDARVEVAVASMSGAEITALRHYLKFAIGTEWGHPKPALAAR